MTGSMQSRPTGRTDGQPLALVVDDYRDGRELVAEILGCAGFAIAEAETGTEALEKALELQPDVVLMDLSLPGMDGWEVTERLRADPRGAMIKIIALTAHALKGPLDRARRAGCDAVVTKPCMPDELVAHVRRVLESAPRSRTGSRR